MGEEEQQPCLAPAAAQIGAAAIRMAPSPPHVRDELLAPRRRRRAPLDGARAHADHDHATLPTPADGGPQRQPPKSVDPEPARVAARGCQMHDESLRKTCRTSMQNTRAVPYHNSPCPAKCSYGLNFDNVCDQWSIHIVPVPCFITRRSAR